MASSFQVPVLICHHRGERIVLPHPTHAGTALYQSHYWPDSRSLTAVCPDCLCVSVYSRADVRFEPFETQDQNQDDNFWKVEFSCDTKNCGLPVLVHTRIEASHTSAQVASLLLSARPGLVCGNGHVLTQKAAVLRAEIVRF